ncbi:MAG: Ig domain-containing protein [Patescibacteria group bacterium]|jgi:hypothetical protein
MKQVKTQVQNKTSIVSKVITGQQIALSLLIVSSFMLGLNFMAMAFSVSRISGPVNGPVIIGETILKTGPLVLKSIEDAAVNIPVYSDGISNPSVEFIADNLSLGHLSLSGGYDPMDIQYSTSTVPLALQLWADNGGEVIPSRIINVQSQGTIHTLCLPETTYTDYFPNKYYYDTNGTPYFDSLLTNKATTLPCNQLLANKLDIGSIDDASVNIPVYSDGINDPEIYFMTNFTPYGYPFGQLNLSSNNYFSSNIGQQYQPGAPLALSFGSDVGTLVPERIINIQSEGTIHTLCLPETLINEGDYILYYYDTNGTPYFDSLLTNKATTLPCNQLLANKLDIGSIDDASVNIPVYSDGINDPEIYFMTNFTPYGYPFGQLNLSSNNYFSSNIGQQYQPGAPLALSFGSDVGTLVPERIINIQSEGTIHTLCLPETLINEGDYILYYYDTNGTPYFDSLLTNKATTLPCNQLLANKLDIGSIDDASVNIPVDSDGISNPEIYFIANFNPYGYPFGGLNLNTNDYFSSNIAQQYQPGAPFALEVFDDENHAIIPERIINIQSQGITHSLCLPETTYTDYMPNIYYYDTNGTPYADTFLTLPITEIPCNEIIGGPAPEITSPLTVNATVGSSFRYTITATNNPTNFRISNLPTGLSFDTSTGVIVGTASVVGTYAVEITALNSVGADTETLTITINPSINSYDRL